MEGDADGSAGGRWARVLPTVAGVSTGTPSGQAAVRHGWLQALVTVVAAALTMLVVASLGLWAAGAAGLPRGAFPPVVAATVVTAVGGAVELSGNAGSLAGTDAGLTVVPLSVSLAGALVVAAGFLRPLRRGAFRGAGGLVLWAARIAVLWLLALAALGVAARHTITLSLGDSVLGGLGDVFGLSPRVGFTAEVPRTLLFGLLWLAGVLVVALLVTRSAPLAGRLGRLREAARPLAYAMVWLLLACVVLAGGVALVVAATRGRPAETFGVILLGLPNLAWLAFTLGLGATWDGRLTGPFGLPLPPVLEEVLRAPDLSTLDVRTLAAHDGRVWWLVVVDAVLVLAAAVLAAPRPPAGTAAWRHALRTAVALALTVLAVCLLGRVRAHWGLSVLGVGDLGGNLAGELLLRPRLWGALGWAALWGLVAGFLGALLARGARAARGRRGGT
ncbi:hypothetical protein P3T26_002324 [Streptomyces sp. MAA16]|nr:hypothetical protein [Streptomyces sp. MAA16]